MTDIWLDSSVEHYFSNVFTEVLNLNYYIVYIKSIFSYQEVNPVSHWWPKTAAVNLNSQLYSAPSRFSPELLGVQASSALVWLIMEVLVVLLSLYLVAINTDLTTIDLLAFSGYKYVGYVIFLCIFFPSPSHCVWPFYIFLWGSSLIWCF